MNELQKRMQSEYGNVFKLNENEYVGITVDGKVMFQCENKFIQFDNLKETFNYLDERLFRIMDIKDKLNALQCDSKEMKMYLASYYEYECLDEYVVIIARTLEEANLLFDKYYEEHNLDASIDSEPAEVTKDNELYADLFKDYGKAAIGVYKAW